MKNSTKMIDSFSQLTSDLRKRLDEENIPWTDISKIIEYEDGCIFVSELTILGNIHDSIGDVFYGWTKTKEGDVIPNSHGYPEKLEFWNYIKKVQPMSIDEIIELYKELQEGNNDERCL